MKGRAQIAAAVALSTSLIACGFEPHDLPTGGEEASASAVAEIESAIATDARILVTPGVAAFYVDLVAPPGSRLVGVEGPAASVDLHATVEEGGVVRMQPRPDGFTVDDDGRLSLAPGGAHAMLLDPEPLEGDVARVVLTLRAADGAETTLPVDARIERLGVEPDGELADEIEHGEHHPGTPDDPHAGHSMHDMLEPHEPESQGDV